MYHENRVKVSDLLPSEFSIVVSNLPFFLVIQFQIPHRKQNQEYINNRYSIRKVNEKLMVIDTLLEEVFVKKH